MIDKQYLKNHEVLLASSSKRRQELLKSLNINFKFVEQNTIEDYPQYLEKSDITDYLSKKKSFPFLKKLKKNQILISSDTIVWFNNKAIGKPKNIRDAKKTLQSLSGNIHCVYTSICISRKDIQNVVNQKTKVYFNKLKDYEIDYYIKNYDVLDRAGSYGIQDYIGHVAIEKIEGCYNNVLGFPTNLFMNTLKRMNIVLKK